MSSRVVFDAVLTFHGQVEETKRVRLIIGERRGRYAPNIVVESHDKDYLGGDRWTKENDLPWEPIVLRLADALKEANDALEKALKEKTP